MASGANDEGRTTPPTTEELSEQIASLRADLSALTHTLTGLGEAKKDEAVTAARLRAGEARARAEDLGRQAVDSVREQPATAVGVAIGLGFLVGYLSGRK